MDLHDKCLYQIEDNKLDGSDYDFLVAQLCVLNNRPMSEMKEVVDNLIECEDLSLKDSNVFINKGKIKEIPIHIDEEEIDKAYKILSKKDKRKEHGCIRIKGKIQITKGGYGFCIPVDKSESEDIFIPERDLKGATNDDVVVVQTIKTGGRRIEGKVVQIIERANDSIVGKITLTKHGAFVSPDDVKFGSDIYVPLNKINGANDGDKVVVSIDKFSNGKQKSEGYISEVLGEPDKISVEVLSIIRAYGLYENFSKRVQELAKEMPQSINPSNYANRKDISNEICFTIDGEDSRDLDDAISLVINDKGNRVLGVHIADVGEYVKRDGIIDKEAFKRGTSVYFPSLVLPMLPRELSNGICSLNENEYRLALTCEIEYDKDAKVINSKFFESLIKSSKRFTYTEVDKILEGDSEVQANNKVFTPILLKMNELAKQLLRLRDVRGGIDFNIPEVKIHTNELGKVDHIEQKLPTDGNRLIEAFMIAANECIAEFFCKRGLPFVYRVHEKPETEKIQKFLTFVKKLGISFKCYADGVNPKDLQAILKQVKGMDSEYAVNKICLRSMQKAKYNSICMGHFGIASEFYCHFTSPIRRYPDLTIHRIIKSFLRGELVGKELSENKRFVLVSSLNSSEREVVAEKVERDVDDLYRAFYMRDKIGEEYEGIVSSVTSFGVFITLPNTVEGVIWLEDLGEGSYEFNDADFLLKSTNNSYFIGKKVKVKVAGVDISSRRVSFLPIAN